MALQTTDFSNKLKQKKMLDSAAKWSWALVRLGLLIGLAYIILYPIIFCLSISIRQPNDMLDPTVVWLPKNLTFDNVKFIFQKTEFVPAFVKTALMSVFCALLQMITCAVTGYGFARFKFKGRNILFLLALMTFIVPPQIISMPLYIQYADITELTGIELINTLFPMTFAALMGQGLNSGLFIYLYRQSFKSMPKELEDAAYLDGCGPLRAFTDIMLINSAPIMLVSFLLSFVWYWNDYINVSLFFNKAKPLSVMLNGLSQTLTTMLNDSGMSYTELEKSVYTTTGCLLFLVVPIIVYVILQKKFNESLMATSIVG